MLIRFIDIHTIRDSLLDAQIERGVESMVCGNGLAISSVRPLLFLALRTFQISCKVEKFGVQHKRATRIIAYWKYGPVAGW